MSTYAPPATNLPPPPPPAMPALAHFTVADYEAMIAAGILGEDRHVELVRGTIVERMPTGSPHSSTVARLFKLCVRRVGAKLDLQSESRITLEGSAPEPDLWIADAPPDSYVERQPRGSELLLVVEIADSSLEQDRSLKLALYAEAGIPEYWIINLRDRVLEQHTIPHVDGTYAAKTTLERSSTLQHQLLGNLVISDILR